MTFNERVKRMDAADAAEGARINRLFEEIESNERDGVGNYSYCIDLTMQAVPEQSRSGIHGKEV